MTYEEKFDLIIRAIEEARKITPSGFNTKLKITYENKLQHLALDDIGSILYQLQDDHRVIKIVSLANAKHISGLDPWIEEQDYFAIVALDKFKEWFKNYLTNHQEEAEQATLPIISHKTSLSDIADEELVKFFEDEMQLLNKLLQICNKNTAFVLLMYPAHLADNEADKAGFNKLETLKDLQKKYKVFNKFKPPLGSTKLPHVQIIKAWINYQNLLKRAEILHDEVESWKGQVLGKEQQKKELLRRLQERFNKYPAQEVFTYSERILGSYRPENHNRPLGYSLDSPDPNRPDISYRFMQTMKDLEKEGHFVIEDVEIYFFAKPEPTEEARDRARWAIGTDHKPREFYPPEHCKVTLRVKRNTKYNEEVIEDKALKSEPSQKGKSYSLDEGVLTIGDNDIKFLETGRKLPYLELLTKKKTYIYHSEAAEEIEGASNTLKNPKNTYYEVCRGIKARISASGITDFLEFDYNKTRINPLYKKSTR